MGAEEWVVEKEKLVVSIVTAEVREYLGAIGRHWGSLVTGGVLIGLLFFRSSYLDVPTPPSWNVAICIGALQVASFLAWRDFRRRLNLFEARPSVHVRHESSIQDESGFLHEYHRFVVKNLSVTQPVIGCRVDVLEIEPETPDVVPGPITVTDSRPDLAFRPQDVSPDAEQRFDFCFVNIVGQPHPATTLSRPNYPDLSRASGTIHCTLQVVAQNLREPSRWQFELLFEGYRPRVVGLRPA